jgi:hypothetical protein
MTGFSKLIIYRDDVLINSNVTTSPWSDPDTLTPNTSYVYKFIAYDSSGVKGSTVYKTFYTLPDLTTLSITSATASQIVLGYAGSYTNVNITRNGTSVATNITGTTFTNTGLIANTSYTYIVTPIGLTGNVGTTLSTTKITLGNITLLSVSSLSASQIVLAYDGSFTNVSITRNGTDISGAIHITGTTFTDTGLTSHTSYTYVITPYNSDGLAGSTSSITKGTLPSLSSLIVYSYTSTQIVLNYTGSYTNVNITRDGSSVATSITGTSFTDTGLIPNVSYTYIVTPKNSSGSGSTLSITQCTLPTMTSISVPSFTATQIVLEYTGFYTNVSIARNGTDISSAITGTSFTDTGLTPHTSYSYVITPYNSLGYAGSTIAITKGTLPNLTSLSVSSFTASQVVLTYGGNYTNVSITRDGSVVATNITGTTFTDTGLTANTTYTYVVIPKNSSGSGTSSSIIQKTLPNITAISILSETTAQIVLSYSGNFTSVSITRDGSSVATNITGTSYTDVGLTPNTSYTYIVTPNNSVGTGSTATITNVTLPNMTSISISSETATSIVLAYTGNYAKVSITRNGTAIASATNITGTSFTDTGLTANTSYTYIVTPKNSESDLGAPSTITNHTSGLISSFSVSSITTTQIVLGYTGTFANVSITRNGSAIATATHITGTAFTDTGLIVNTSYVYVITPYDSDGDAGITSSVTQSTLPNLVSFGITSETSSQIVLNFSGNYINVNITRDGSSIATGVTTTTYTDSGLTANTSYTYIVTPVNSSGNLGTTSSSIVQKTLPSMTTVSISSRTTTQIVLALSGNYTSVSITRGGTAIATGVTTSTYTDTGLTANNAYVYVVTPVNSVGSGSAITTSSFYTLPSLTLVTEGTIDSESIGMTFSGLYSYVIVTRTNGGLTSGNITGTTYTDSSGLSGSTEYSYTIIPYTLTSVAGSSVSFSATTSSAIASLSSLTVPSITTTQIVLAYSGSYTSVNITRDGSSIATGVTTSTYTDTGLTVNTSYTYVVTPYNILGIGTASTITKKTSPNMTALSISGFTTTQIVLSYTGNFTNVSITRDGSSIATGVTTSTYTNIGLTANTSYVYVVAPYNSDGLAGITSTITKSTLPSMTSISVSSETDTQIVLAYTGNFTNVSISRDGTSMATGVTTSTYTDSSGLNANTSYTYVVTPYNLEGIIGNATVTITKSTLPSMTTSVLSETATQIVLAFSGSYTNVSITRDGTSIATNVIGSTYTDSSGLTANTSYTYVITPYNSDNNAGSASSITQSTLSNITSLSVSSETTTQIVLAYTGNYTSVSITRNGTSIATSITGTTYTDTGLTTNTSYTYIVTPNGSAGAGTLSTITKSTLPTMTALSITSTTVSQIVLTFSGNYTSLSITRNGTIIETDISGITYTDSGLTANTSYTYIFTPYNSDSIAGSTLTITQSTLTNITSLSVSSFTASQIVLAYTGGYTNVSITRGGTSIATDVSGTTYTDTGLTGNTSYTYIVTPNDASGNSGTSSTITQITQSTVSSLSITSTTVSQIVLAFSGNYTNVSITRNGISVATDISGTTYTDTGLTGNTENLYIITPYNSVGVPGATSTITQTTLPNLTSLSSSNVTDTEIILMFPGNFTSVSITRGGTSIATDVSGTTYTDSGLSGNTSYIYIVTPYNSVGTGTSLTITKTTISNLTSLSVSSFTTSQIVLAFAGSYTSVSITRDGTAIATGVTGTTYTDASGLNANTSYTYIVTPYDSSGNSGTSSSITKTTQSSLSSLSVSSFTTSQIVLAFAGSYTNVSITREGISIATGVTDTTYRDASGLNANTSYTYIITPYNSDGISGSTSTVSQSTLEDVALLTSLSITSKTSTQIVLAYTGNYTSISITRNGTSIATGITSSTYTDASGLSAKTSYAYIFTPYNSNGVAGTTSSITVETLPTLTTLSITGITESQIALAFTGSFTNVSITRGGASIATGITDTTYMDSSGLTAFTSYTYIVTPYNSSGDSGSTQSITQNTSPLLTSFTGSSVSTTEIDLVYDGSYTNVSISRNGSAISNATNITGTTFADTGLNTNTSYTYIITPNDASGNVGSALSLTKRTLPSLTSLDVSSGVTTSSQIVLTYDGSYTNVSISRNGTDISSATHITGTTFTDTDLSANTSYAYIVTPFNSSDISGATSSITHSTLPNVTSLSISSFSVSQIVLAFSGNYTNVSITRDGSSIITGLTASTYTDTGLNGNTAYVYSVIPYNSSNVSGYDSSITQVTLSIISSLSVSNKTDSQIILGYSGNYTDVSITRNGSSIASHFTGISYTDTGLIGDTSYIYVFTPYNSSNIAGSTSSITIVTLPYIVNG